MSLISVALASHTLTSAQKVGIKAREASSHTLPLPMIQQHFHVNLMRNGLGKASGSVSVACDGGANGRDTGKSRNGTMRNNRRKNKVT